MDQAGRLLLLDSASLYFRAFYGVPDQRTDPSEPPTNAIRGFLDMVATLVDRHRPTHLAACWDNDWRPQFRVQAIPSYKTHRVAAGADPSAPGGVAGAGGAAASGASGASGDGPSGLTSEEAPDDLAPQVPLIAAALAALGIARVGVDGFEADDVIGALAHRHRGTLAVDIVTGDRDLFQLVDDALGVRVLYTSRGGVRDAEIVDQAVLQERYAVPTGDAYADLAVLRGDASDGLPGVAGIGEKTAAALLATYGSLAGIRAAVDGGDPRIKGAQRTRLEAGAAYLDVAPGVVRVAVDAPLPDVDLRLPTQVADPVLMSRLAVDYGLTGAFNRVLSALGVG
ncbi:MAG: 5'-3' exonuclease [Actinomycetales bacterium]|jgi:5'-3' exonuclease|uniref:5'-3' exonuclease n=1 Tax=Candidatus Phosphoribacter hodrii TaxID=2953743 RepID=A0A935M621_9MICO|nr:5'-3' exonuclease [Candidatus Phosphoribacter hodrii]MBK7272469.1 5'-3' exonuclease [Candidatus Phosphoribacter hodrii]HRC65308.1 5'-3' exonuclease [Dermatophilaceae bacterium]